MSQLETNTTDLRSILAQVNALPDAGSGGGINIVTGKYANTRADFMTQPVSISGFGFRPKFVYFYCTSNIITDLSTPYTVKSVMWKDGDEESIYINISLSGGKTYAPTVERSCVTVTDDGFTLTSPRSDYTLVATGAENYAYVVIG